MRHWGQAGARGHGAVWRAAAVCSCWIFLFWAGCTPTSEGEIDCVPGLDPGCWTLEGTPCSEAVPCPGQLECAAGRCRLATPPPSTRLCTNSAECSRADEVCLAGRCDRVLCADDLLCPADARCLSLICRYAPLCDTDAACERTFGACVEGRCQPGCETNAECGGSSQTACIEGRCTLACVSTLICAPGERCRDGFCQLDECSGFSSDDCGPGLRCNGQGQCTPVRACSRQEDCAASERCDAGLCEGRQTCRLDADCASLPAGRCESGYCLQARPCTGGSRPCLVGERCIGGACTSDGCRANAECLEGERCVRGRCTDRPEVRSVARLRVQASQRVLYPGESAMLSVLAFDADEEALRPSDHLRAELELPGGASLQGEHPWEITAPPSVELARELRVLLRRRDSGALVGTTTFHLLPHEDEGTRSLRILNAWTGEPIAQASVLFGDQARRTDALGVVRWVTLPEVDEEAQETGLEQGGEQGAPTVVVEHPAYVTTSALLTEQGPGVLGLRPADGATVVWEGATPFGASTEPSFSVHGASDPSSVMDASLQRWFGALRDVEVGLPNIEPLVVPIPGGVTLSLNFLGVEQVQGRFHRDVAVGERLLWSFGTTFPIQRLTAWLEATDPLPLERALATVLGYGPGFRTTQRLDLMTAGSAYEESHLLLDAALPHRAALYLPRWPFLGEQPLDALMLICERETGLVGRSPIGFAAWTPDTFPGNGVGMVRLDGVHPETDDLGVICFVVGTPGSGVPLGVGDARWPTALLLFSQRFPTTPTLIDADALDWPESWPTLRWSEDDEIVGGDALAGVTDLLRLSLRDGGRNLRQHWTELDDRGAFAVPSAWLALRNERPLAEVVVEAIGLEPRSGVVQGRSLGGRSFQERVRTVVRLSIALQR